MPTQTIKAAFVGPMLLLPASKLPEGAPWMYELKLDGYRAIAFRSNGRAQLRSRNNNDFNRKYPAVAAALAGLPDETVVDGEVVALDESGRPCFNALQNWDSASARIVYYVFDVLVLAGHDVMSEPLAERRNLLGSQVLPKLKYPIRESPELEASLSDVIGAVRAQGLEGVVAKNRNSPYEQGRRSGAWQKMRLTRAKSS